MPRSPYDLFLRDPVLDMNPEMKKKLSPGLLQFISTMGISYFVIVLLYLIYVSIYHTIPVVYDEDSGLRFSRYCIAAFLIASILLNFLFVCRKRSFYKSKANKSVGGLPDPSWKHCVECEQHVPPRAHHCPLCQNCVLRRDHHCYFTASCVGYENQRYFVIFCFYVAAGCGYAFYLIYQYIVLEFCQKESISFVHFIIIVTFFEWVLGYATYSFFSTVFSAWIGAITCSGGTCMFVWQVFIISQGVTGYEFGKGIRTYKLAIPSILYNIRSVFGPYWLLNFIIPMPWFKTPGNGIDFTSSKFV